MSILSQSEINVIGAVFTEPKLINEVVEKTGFESFASPYNKILEAIHNIVSGKSKRFKKVSVSTVWEMLKQEKTGLNREQLGSLVGHVTSREDFDDSLSIIADNSVRVLLKEKLDDIRALINANEHLDDVMANIDGMRASATKQIERFTKPPTMRDRLELVRAGIDDIVSNPEQITGIPSGYPRIDYFTGGFQDEFIIVGGTPSMGKTALMLDICNNSVRYYDYKPAFFSYEMSIKQLLLRLVCAESGIAYIKIKRGRINRSDQERLNQIIDEFQNLNIYLDENMYDLDVLVSKIETVKDIHDIDYAVVDYIQLIPVPKSFEARTREEEIGIISKTLKALVKRLEIPIIAVAQLSRLAARKSGEAPSLDELRDSGSLEADADIVIFVHRPYKYGIKVRKGKNMKNVAEIIIAKNRNGPTGTAEIIWDSYHGRFANPAMKWISIKGSH